MRWQLDRFDFRIGPTTVALVKSTDDDCLWCAHTMRFSSFRRLCVQQKTKIAWCEPGLKFTNICHLSDHLTNLSMSSCNLCLYPISLDFLNSLVSSANFNILPVTPSSKSLMYTKNKIGPSTEPCGTPLKTYFQLEPSPSTTTFFSCLSVTCPYYMCPLP